MAVEIATSCTAAKRTCASLGFERFGTEPRAVKVGRIYVDEDHMIPRLAQS